jgi:hypothetical protein
MPRCKNGTRRNKKTGLCQPYKKGSPSKSSSKTRKARTPRRRPNKHLSDADIETVMRVTGTQVYSPMLRPQLEKLTYHPKYIGCFGDKPANLYEEAVDRVECWLKYGASGAI